MIARFYTLNKKITSIHQMKRFISESNDSVLIPPPAPKSPLFRLLQFSIISIGTIVVVYTFNYSWKNRDLIKQTNNQIFNAKDET